MKTKSLMSFKIKKLAFAIGAMVVIVCAMFWRSFLPDYVHFSNDGPLGQQNAAWFQMPESITGMWGDLNYIGESAGTFTLSITAIIHTIVNPVLFAKIYPAVTLFLLGLGAWTFFQQLKLSPVACILGAFAAMLNSTFFSTACWGVASQEIALSMVFFALALLIGCRTVPPWTCFARLALAGLCVGMNVIEAADIGALLSILVAVFTLFEASTGVNSSILAKATYGLYRVFVLTVFALFIALQSVLALVGTNIQGVAGTAQDTGTKAAHWDWATQWSLPKVETLGLVVPGLFGYKMDTPKDMQPSLQDAYRSGLYWGGVGRAPELDRYFDSGSQGPEPSGQGLFMRFTGGGNYCGILVLLVAGWAIAQAFRRRNSVFPDDQRRMIQYWTVIMMLCLLFAWGRFAPFYALLYKLPYFSTIRNPAKFIIFFSWALVIVFGYGMHALSRRYLDFAAVKGAGASIQLKTWWARADKFDRKWAFTVAGFFIACILGWLIYTAQKPSLIAYLQKVGFGDTDPNHETSAPAIVAFSIGQVEWFLVLLAIASGLLFLTVSGYFNGSRAKLGSVLLGAFLIFDMGRANLPWIVHWDYKQKYEVGSLNPILKFLADKPYEHRVAGLPFRTPQGLELFDELYRIEWVQHHFPYYNIQSLDVVQEPRMPEDKKEFKEALVANGMPLFAREWQLTNTRYLLGPAGFLEVMNEQLDPVQHRFRIVQRFDVLPKPGISQPTRLEELTAVPSENGNYALFEFTGALPRAKIYSNWEVNTNDTENLKKLADLNFDPVKTVLVSTPEAGMAPSSTNENSGSVEYDSYASKHIVLSAETTTPSVLLLNDKFDPHWSVSVDGKPSEVLRCNFIMRGVYLPSAGKHTVTFSFSLPHERLYITLSALVVAILLCGFLAISSCSTGGLRNSAR